MVFASLVFLSLFLPLVFAVGCLLRRRVRWQNVWLCAASLCFYAWGEPVYVLLLVASALINGRLAVRMAAAQDARLKNWLTGFAVVLNMGMLLVFKYAGFFVRTAGDLLRVSLPVPEIALPLGVSFFTFQALSYVLDVRMGRAQPAPNLGRVLLYLSFFPQLIAGPIVQWRDIAGQLERRTMTAQGAARGLRRFTVGLAKKVLLADVLARVADAAFGCPQEGLGPGLAWLGAVAYTLQIYLDFSGYSDMGIGMGQMFGFTLPENFRHPFCAASMADFWRRWHITLTDWFRDYVYIPLGGNRRGTLRTYRNLGAVFLLTGLWHGAAWTFVLWGAWNGLFVMLERRALPVAKWPRPLAHGYTLMVVVLGFVIFRAADMAQALAYARALVMSGGDALLRQSYLLAQCTPENLCALGLALCAGFGVGARAWARLGGLRWVRALSYAVAGALLVLCYAALVASGYHPFIYFRF